MTFKQLLMNLGACEDARIWAGDKTIDEVVNECERADWLLWLAEKVKCDRRKLVLCGGLCANTVRHLMNDHRSIKAVDVAIAYGEGRATDDDLAAARAAAWDAAWAVARAAAWDAAWAAEKDAAWAAAWDAAWAVALKDMADIIRPVIKDELLEKVNKLLQMTPYKYDPDEEKRAAIAAIASFAATVIIMLLLAAFALMIYNTPV